ncbi:methyltransferase [Amorphoplanes auranticolor]|uniref:Methyltransferase n=1 Tax=Actinoplanes auranticolor TaxID=47988 RepID=A0A919S949_9ACTN|nr:methyltransferase [Actinoplanes auranticolor]
MQWVKDFYSRTGSWWGPAEARISERDHQRLSLLHAHLGTEPAQVLELGAGYGSTAAVTAQAGHAVTAIEISDRADFAEELTIDAPGGSLTFIKDDFYSVDLPRQFDVVCYWDGFGVGSDADQRRLLRRIATQWLRPGGTALIDVFNPFVWAQWDGDEEHRTPNPDLGYEHELFERVTFDPVTCTATDTWWDAARPDEKISQRLRCYTPADLALLLAGTQLELATITAGDLTFEATRRPEDSGLLRRHASYLAILRLGPPVKD